MPDTFLNIPRPVISPTGGKNAVPSLFIAAMFAQFSVDSDTGPTAACWSSKCI